jgi:hypothetical protein
LEELSFAYGDSSSYSVKDYLQKGGFSVSEKSTMFYSFLWYLKIFLKKSGSFGLFFRLIYRGIFSSDYKCPEITGGKAG